MTPMQERFAQEVASGKSQSAAYRIAYPGSLQWKEATVWNKASALMRDKEVSARVDAIRDELRERGIWTREQSAKALIGVVDAPDKPSDIVAAVKELNAMHGYNAPQKIENSGDMLIRWQAEKS